MVQGLRLLLILNFLVELFFDRSLLADEKSTSLALEYGTLLAYVGKDP